MNAPITAPTLTLDPITLHKPHALRTIYEGEGKGRTFQCGVLAIIRADKHWESGSNDICRPAMISLAGTSMSLKPVVAQLRMGGKVLLGPMKSLGDKKPPMGEFLRSASYRSFAQTLPGNVAAVTLYLPEVFEREPWNGREHRGLVTIPEWWAQTHIPDPSLVALANRLLTKADLGDRPQLALRMALAAPMVTHYLDLRVEAPIPRDPAFRVHLMVEMLTHGALRATGDAHDISGTVDLTQTHPVFRDVWELQGLGKTTELLGKLMAKLKPAT